MQQTFPRAAILAAAFASLPIAAHADAVADQSKAYQALGIGVEKPPAMCRLITKGEAARYLGKPVQQGTSAGSAAGCAYRAVDDPNQGILVTRQARGNWFPPSYSKDYKIITGLGGPAYTNYEQGVGFEAAVQLPNGITNVQLSGKGNAATAVALLRLAMRR